MTKSLDESIVIQALRDLLSTIPRERVEALEFFLVGGHEGLCSAADLDAKAIKNKVAEAAKHEGIRRKKLVKDLIRELPRN